MERREFLVGAAAVAGMATTGFAQAGNQAKGNPVKLQRIAIMSLCFDSMLKNGMTTPEATRTLDVMDFPQMIADRYGVHHLEMQHSHFLSTDDAYLKDFRDRAAKAKSDITQINLEFAQSHVSAGYSARAQAIDLTRSWIDHAVALGSPRVMVNQGSLAPEVRQDAIAALKIMGDYGKAKKVSVSVENRGAGGMPPAQGGGGGRQGGANPPPPPTPPPTWQTVVEVIKAAGIYANPDVGNFPNEEERAAGLKVMYLMTSGSSHCHYDPSKYNFANAIKISKDVGYKGLYSIEANAGNNPDPNVATKMIMDELLKLI